MKILVTSKRVSLGLAIGTVYQRLKYGFTLEQALTFKKGQKRA